MHTHTKKPHTHIYIYILLWDTLFLALCVAMYIDHVFLE